MNSYQCSLNESHIIEANSGETPKRCQRLIPIQVDGQWVAYKCQGHLSPCEPKYDLRLYDGFDRTWISIARAMDKTEAEKLLAKYTQGGRKNTSYSDIDYYAIFPSQTRMIYSLERDLLDMCTHIVDAPLPNTKTQKENHNA